MTMTKWQAQTWTSFLRPISVRENIHYKLSAHNTSLHEIGVQRSIQRKVTVTEGQLLAVYQLAVTK